MSKKCEVIWLDIDGALPKPKYLSDETDSLYHCPIKECDHDGFQSQEVAENMFTPSIFGSFTLMKNPIEKKSQIC